MPLTNNMQLIVNPLYAIITKSKRKLASASLTYCICVLLIFCTGGIVAVAVVVGILAVLIIFVMA